MKPETRNPNSESIPNDQTPKGPGISLVIRHSDLRFDSSFSSSLSLRAEGGFRHSDFRTPTSPRRRAFTLIELLVVIGIILILVGLFFGGAKIVTAQAKERDTKTMLQTCKSMFENYRQATRLSRYPGNLLTGGYPALSFGPAVSSTSTWYTAEEPATSAVSPDALGLSAGNPIPTTTSPQILIDSAYVYMALESLPENQTIITNIPPNKKINVLFGTTTVVLPLDGWGNVILFVPGGGLGTSIQGPQSLWIDGTQIGIVTSTQIYSGMAMVNYKPATSTTPSANQPFFVSAGPDGDLGNAHGWTFGSTINSSMTDDNLYSFQ